MQQHTLKAFDADIDGMRSAIMTMGGLVEEQFSRAIDAIERSDLRLIAQVLTDEEVVNQQHLQADLLCNQILAKRQPFAVDLREVIGAIHTVNDLERIGDEAKKIALKARVLHLAESPIAMDRIDRMSVLVREMLDLALDAFVRHDARIAGVLGERDDEVDALRDELIEDLMATMSSRPDTVSPCLALIFVVQSIERVGDHAENIAQYVVNVVEGIDLRHASPADTGGGPSAS